MAASLQRLRRPFRRRSQFTSQSETLVACLRTERKKQRQEQLREEYLDDEPHGVNGSCHELPNLLDRESYSQSRFPNSGLNWSSVILETDSEKMTRMKCESGREHARHLRFQNEMVSHKRRHSQVQGTREYLHGLSMTEEEKCKDSSNCNHPRAQESWSQICRSGEHDRMKDRDSDSAVKRWLTPKPAPVLEYSNLLKPLPKKPRPDGPLSPGSRDWDEFMDFPTEHFSESYSKNVDNQATAQSKVTTISNQEILQTSSPVPHVRAQDPCAQPNGIFALATTNEPVDQTLQNEQVDLVEDEAPENRARERLTINDNGVYTPLITTESDSVSNFSYPLAGNTLYRLQATEQAQNQISFNNDVDPYSWPIMDNKKETIQLPDSGTEDMFSSFYSLDSLYRLPTPISMSRKRIDNVLENVPMAAEIDIHNKTIDTSPPRRPSTINQSIITTNQTSTIHNLQNTISTLQKHITSLEDTLVPQLTARVERRNSTIRDLELTIHKLRDEITDLKIAIDFSNKILGGCWVREWEIWRTLAQIVEKRRRRRSGLLYRLFTSPQRQNHRDLGKGDVSNGYEWQVCAQGPNPTGLERAVAHMKGERWRRRDGKREFLVNRQVDALYLMAAQNLRILEEKVAEMLRLARGCKGAIVSGIQDNEPAEGWKEV